MDKLDVRILGDLLGVEATSPGIRRPLRSIARDLGVDETTVRNRLDQLRRSGFLRGWMVSVNPELIGERVAQVWLDVAHRTEKAGVLREIALVEGVGLILDYFGTALSVQVFFDEERTLGRTLELIGRLAGADDVESARIAFPKTRATLSKKDWEIVLSLHRNPWKSFTKIGDEVGVSTATVKRRLARMDRAKALYLLVDIDPKATEGSLLTHLTVFYDDPARRPKVDAALLDGLREEIAFAELDNPDHGFFALMLRNVARVQEISEWLRDRPGIRRARVDILQDIIAFPQLHESFLERGLRASTRA